MVGARAGLAFRAIWATVRQPRFAMSFGMAFFALSVGLTVAGVKPADLRQISLRPSAIRLTYYHTQARVVHYYENVRSCTKSSRACAKIKRTVAPAEPGRKESRPAKQKDDKNDTTHTAPSRSRSAITARSITNSFWPALLRVISMSTFLRSACSVGDH